MVPGQQNPNNPTLFWEPNEGWVVFGELTSAARANLAATQILQAKSTPAVTVAPTQAQTNTVLVSSPAAGALSSSQPTSSTSAAGAAAQILKPKVYVSDTSTMTAVQTQAQLDPKPNSVAAAGVLTAAVVAAKFLL